MLYVNRFFLLLAFVGAAGFAFEAQAAETSEAEKKRRAPYVVETEWLKKNINNKDIVVIDAREEGTHKDQFLPKAVKINPADTYGKADKKHMLAPILSLQEIMSKAGINKDVHVVVYDLGELKFAARILWILEFLGHDKVSVLNGGIDKWAKEGFTMAQMPHQPTKPAKFIPRLRPEYHSGRSYVFSAINNPSVTIVDARTPEEYLGKKSKTKKMGHILSAINVPSIKYFEKKEGYQVLMDTEQFKSMHMKLNKNKKALAYCNSGKDSAITFLILRRLGYQISLYDGAWSDWSEDDSLPISMLDE